ncbi:helix-turn-helix domain-containing protein [Flaviaesturariibacter aridisoli]|uniref:HTH iclR-type domain-containing protein n=1 Tax=Flaviaesturariibacter aridisoli TaxID=2545761 RepID=A0A4R4DZ92_9BACT|nr:helix-turn-helix domain-containing protein [Flaviaesturariibacter aridisoli]TCZ69657.1 hypothetical protein E0486_12090 [Flaviaesturariibacter aridisoli]
MEWQPEQLLAEIRRLELLTQALSARNGVLEYLLRQPGMDGMAQAPHPPMPFSDRNTHPHPTPIPPSDRHTDPLLLPIQKTEGHPQEPVLPLQFPDRHTPQLHLPTRVSDRAAAEDPRPLRPSDGPERERPARAGGGLAACSVRVLAPSAPSGPLPGCAELVAVLKKNGMAGTKTGGVIRAARLLLLVAAGGGPVSTPRICSELGLSPSGAAKLLASLRRRHWLLRTGTYGLMLSTEAKALLALAARPTQTPSHQALNA